MNIAFLVVLLVFSLPETDGNRTDDRHERDHEEHKKWKKSHKKDPGWWFYKHKIEVSDTQWKNLRPEMEAFHLKAYEICRKIRKLRNDILSLIERPNPDRERIRTKEEKIIDLKAKKQQMFVDYMISKKKFLNTKQERKFFGILKKDRDCHKHSRTFR